ncbi:hypothetical protein [Flammeovirga aprica]|uniref:hypothetical protein n=1 Tax=Flammeovirga aprica TaxID=29528 RepID=UPI001981EF3D|nr:hypothetical protein [Flammeovirga aprica]
MFGLLIISIVSCIGYQSTNKPIYIGNFKEKQYDFFESIRHEHLIDYYYKLPFELKFGGIKPFPYDSIGMKDYSWLRNPENLKIAFNAFSTVGLDKFISKEKYFERNNDWCCNTDWENKSLHEIVTGFINSDTTTNGSNYYSKFWKRRKLENTHITTYEIFTQIDRFYNQNDHDLIYKNQDTILLGLLDFDSKLALSDSIKYQDTAIECFNFLKSVELEYSAYKLICNNPRLNLDKNLRDSLIMTMNYDTLTVGTWEKLDDNRNGWITSGYYRDTNRYYGP